MNEVDLKNNVMRRVYIAYAIRKAFSPLMVKLYIAIVLGWQLTSSVSVSNVFANVPSITDPGNLYNFVTSAFLNTELWVQIIVSAFVLWVIWFSRDLLKRGDYGIQRKTS